ncbi:MAG: glycosyltransferase family 2 protein [Akkermansia sp.]|nr:glycosyltransferase family 2 protein [Akkermansia sp.]
MISIVIPLYNKEKQISETLRSVLQQSFQNFEIVVVNDGSTDGSVSAVHSVKDDRIRVFHQNNAGVSAARNRGVEEARCDFIAFLDADDRWQPEYLQTQYELAQKYPECTVFACSYEFVHADGSVHPSIIRKLPFEGTDGILSNYFEVASCSNPPLWTSAVMVRKKRLQSMGGFPPGIKSGEDLLTWARLACTGQIAYSRSVLAQFISTPPDGVGSKASVRMSQGDPVLQSLQELEHLHGRNMPAIGSYIHRWIKIQAVIALEVGNYKKARHYSQLGISRGGSWKAFLPLFLISLLPACVVSLILKLK